MLSDRVQRSLIADWVRRCLTVCLRIYYSYQSILVQNSSCRKGSAVRDRTSRTMCTFVRRRQRPRCPKHLRSCLTRTIVMSGDHGSRITACSGVSDRLYGCRTRRTAALSFLTRPEGAASGKVRGMVDCISSLSATGHGCAVGRSIMGPDWSSGVDAARSAQNNPG